MTSPQQSHSNRTGSDITSKAKDLAEVVQRSRDVLHRVEEEASSSPELRKAVEVEMTNLYFALPRFKDVARNYTADEVVKLRSYDHSFQDLSVATRMAEKLWKEVTNTDPTSYIHTLGAMNASQAIQIVQAGIKAIYLSGWQVAADANLACDMFPDQSLYPSDSVPAVVRRINNGFSRQEQVARLSNQVQDWHVPIVADAEAGFGGPLNCYTLMKQMVEAGAAGVHFEDQVAAFKKCGHMGGKVILSTYAAIQNLLAARLASDVLGVPTLVIGRTDTRGGTLAATEIDERDRPFINLKERTSEGFYRLKGGMDLAIARGIALAPYADLIWCETDTPDLKEAKDFADGLKEAYPDRDIRLAYNCSPSFNWKAKLTDSDIAIFQRELGAMGYKFQFITLAGFHQINMGMFDLAYEYKDEGMTAYVRLQQDEFAAQERGYRVAKHQSYVGAGHFDLLSEIIARAAGGQSSTGALSGSTEEAQFRAEH